MKEAQKMDENLDNYIQYLLAKVAEADKPLSAIDLDWSKTKIQDLVLFRYFLENSMTQLARVTEVTDCMYS